MLWSNSKRVQVERGDSYISAALGKKSSCGVANAVQLGGTGNNGKLSLEVRHCDGLFLLQSGFGVLELFD